MSTLILVKRRLGLRERKPFPWSFSSTASAGITEHSCCGVYVEYTSTLSAGATIERCVILSVDLIGQVPGTIQVRFLKDH